MSEMPKKQISSQKMPPPPPPPTPGLGQPEVELSLWGFREWRARRKKRKNR
ncbi:MAG TPA: hypothetical protein VF030_09170 [Solirubrobacterales bacterium]